MIQKVKAYQVGEQLYPSIEAAQRAELEKLCDALDDGAAHVERDRTIDLILSNKAAFVDVLTMRKTSRPAARTTHGGTKKREKKSQKPSPASQEAVNRELQDMKP